MAEIIHAPEGAEFDVNFYLVSDVEEIEVVVGLKGMPALSEFSQKADAAQIADHFNLDRLASDWRLMTREEIRDYKQRDRDERLG